MPHPAADQEDGTPFADAPWPLLRTKLERAVARSCPPWLRDRSEDLVQASLVRLLELQKKSEGIREFKSSYLWRVAYTTLIDEIRRLKRRQEVALEDDASGAEPAAENPTPEHRTRDREIGRGIKDCLTTLVEARAQAVTLNLVGHSVPQAARLLDWSIKKTENLVYRGLADLRRCLDTKGLRP